MKNALSDSTVRWFLAALALYLIWYFIDRASRRAGNWFAGLSVLSTAMFSRADWMDELRTLGVL